MNCRHSRLSRLAAVGVGLLTVVAVPHAQAQTFTAFFPSGSSTVVGGCLNPPGSLSYFSSVSRGDKVEQTFSSTGLNSITGLELNFDVTHNELSPAAQVDWDVRVNGTPAGTWQWTAGEGLGPVHLSYTFAPIVGGGTYDVGMFVKKIGIGAAGNIARRQVEQPARFVVDQHDAAFAINGQHAIAHVSHHVAEEHVFQS